MLVLRAGRELQSRSSGRAFVSRADERAAARRLAEVLDGAEPLDADLAVTARVLRERRRSGPLRRPGGGG